MANSDNRHDFFSSIYGFHMVQGSRSGDPRIFEVFYGARPYDQKVEFIDQQGRPLERPRKRLLSEKGASLIYSQLDNGAVLCALEPAYAEGFARKESSILMNYVRNPKRLLKESVPRSHWRYLMAYMEVSSLDGDPTLWERLQVWCLMKTRHLFVKELLEPPRYWTWIKYATWFVLAVGFNGFAVAIIQAWLNGLGTNGIASGVGPG